MPIRHLFAALVLALALPLAPTVEAADMPPGLRETTLYHLEVQGMSCPFCAYNVERRLNRLDGVKYVEVNLDKGLVAIAVADENPLRRKELAPLFVDAGFKLKGMREVPLNRANLAIR